MLKEERHLIYENPLASAKDIKDFVLEGSAAITFPQKRMRMENLMAQELGQKANYVLWCPEEFPSDIEAEWDFRPIKEPGLCMLFFSARGRNNKDIFDPELLVRTGEYQTYYGGDINAFHVSYFRRKMPDERAFHTCNLRKSYGFNLVCQGADPIPSAADAMPPYHISLVKFSNEIIFKINDLAIFQWKDDGITYGPLLAGGKIGFRQMAPMMAEYSNLKVYSLNGK